MTSASTSLRGLLIYAAILPLALLIGYMMATPLDASSFVIVGLAMFVLSLPLMLKWHRPILFLTWNMTAVLFFVPGRPQVWVGAAFLSFVVVVIQKAMLLQSRPIRVNLVTVPLVFLVTVVFVTAYFTGGVGFRAFGSDVVGGKAYFWILAATLGYFALTAYPLAEEKRRLYLNLFLLGALANAIGSSLDLVAPSFYYIFLLFPVDRLSSSGEGTSIGRYFGLAISGMALFYYLLSRYPIKDLLTFKRALALLLLIFATVIVLGSGYRSHFLLITLVFAAVFYFEGLLRSRFALFFLCAAVVLGGLALPFSTKLPMPIQRTISVVPMIEVSSQARVEAQLSTDWRINMWRVVIPEIPKYFWLGKGIGINSSDLEMAQTMGNRGPMGPYEVALQTGAYHNGPLTILIPFGIWGLAGWLWFLGASFRALYLNYRYCEPEMKTPNTFLIGLFCAKALYYFTIFGEFREDFPFFVGIIAVSLTLNNGVCRPAQTRSSIPAHTLSAPREPELTTTT
jgi:hypothetical protein